MTVNLRDAGEPPRGRRRIISVRFVQKPAVDRLGLAATIAAEMNAPNRERRRPVIGLIGGIGSGKSLVAEILAELGCPVIDADRIGHALLERSAIREALVERFGDGIIAEGGRVDRRRLGQAAFSTAGALAGLNAIVHPPLRRELEAQVEAFREGDAPAAVLDAALLLETDWHELCDTIVFVDSPFEQRLARVLASRGWDEARLAGREKMQKPLDIKRAQADHIVRNNSSVSRLRQQVHLLYQALTGSQTE